MKTLPLLALAALAFAACSTVDSRISGNQSQFDSWPPAVQQKVRAGQVDIGFTPAQAQVALGDPDRKYTRTDAHGTVEVWAYQDHSPVFSFGLGVGTFSHSSAYGGGIGVTTGGDRYDDKLRVIFAEGKVVALERSTTK
ncbi:MAG TPA: hypothetical protein VMI53_13705 [Opitutaceae bacterium]|nr:hypothetical protein [Opitutaceae bacterium]